MKKIYVLILLALIVPALTVSAQDMSHFRVKGPIPQSKSKPNTDRTEIDTLTNVYINYMQSDSTFFHLGYFTNYMFYMNSRYTMSDTGHPLANELLLHSFTVMFDTIFDAAHDTGYAHAIAKYIYVDSLHIIIGHSNTSLTTDTIVVQIDSVDQTGYPTSTVLSSDTVFTTKSLSPGNNWLNPYILSVRPNFPYGYLVRMNMFAVTVSYYGSKQDTMGFLPGFPYSNCKAGGSGPIPEETKLGWNFSGLNANSLTNGYQYFFDTNLTIPTKAGLTNGLYLPCTNPSSKYWYFQDNPISAYITFINTTGIDELHSVGFFLGQNYPDPYSANTQIPYSLAKPADIIFTVSDITGRQLLVNKIGNVSPGKHSILLNASTFAPGVYFYTFTVNGASATRKMMITR